MDIKIGYDFNNNEYNFNDNSLNDEEVELIKAILTHLGLNYNDYTFVANSKTYTTLKFGEYDLIRLHNSNSSCWIKLPIFNKNKYENDSRFEEQKNKNELYWKSTINNIFDYEDIITDAIEGIIKANTNKKQYAPSEEEINIIVLLMNDLNIDYDIDKTSNECTSVYFKDTPRVIFDIKCTSRSKWIRFRGKDFNNKIDISDLTDELISKLKKRIKKEE